MRLQVRPKGRIVYPSTTCALRTDESFRERFDPEHHNSYSCLEELEIDMVLDLPLDPMHVVDEGACHKYFVTILFDSDYKISPYHVKRVNENMSLVSPYSPCEVARKTRPFTAKMKCTEWRQIRLYTGPVVLINHLSPDRYAHFLTFHVATKILSSPRFYRKYINYAKELLLTFVRNGVILYGNTFCVYNIHNLIHIANDCENFGPMQSFSAYPFENHLGVIKRLSRKSEKPLQQVVKRLAELDHTQKIYNVSETEGFVFKFEHNDGPVLKKLNGDEKQYRQVNFKNFVLCATKRDNCAAKGDNCELLEGNLVVIIENFIEIGSKQFIIGRAFESLTNLYPEPFYSPGLDIYKCENLSGTLQQWPIEKVLFKVYLMPIPNFSSFCSLSIRRHVANLNKLATVKLTKV